MKYSSLYYDKEKAGITKYKGVTDIECVFCTFLIMGCYYAFCAGVEYWDAHISYWVGTKKVERILWKLGIWRKY